MSMQGPRADEPGDAAGKKQWNAVEGLEGEPERHARPVTRVLGAGLEHEDTGLAILGKACGDNRPGRAAADDYVVVFLGRHRHIATSHRDSVETGP